MHTKQDHPVNQGVKLGEFASPAKVAKNAYRISCSLSPAIILHIFMTPPLHIRKANYAKQSFMQHSIYNKKKNIIIPCNKASTSDQKCYDLTTGEEKK